MLTKELQKESLKGKLKNLPANVNYFWPIFPFYTPWKYQILVLLRGIKWEQWPEMAKFAL